MQCNGLLDVICPERIDPTAKRLIELLPRPDDPTRIVNNYRSRSYSTSRTRLPSIKADYTFNDNGTERKVHNELRSSFEFKGGLIIKHTDDCDARKWAMQALGPVKGIAAWLVPTLRQKKAKEKLQGFISRHPEYRQP